TIHDNVISLHVQPGAREGDPAGLQFHPAVEFYRIDNRVRTVGVGGERRIHFSRIPGSLEARLWGTIPMRDRGQDMLLGIEDPALYAAQVFRRALEERGIVVEGDSTAQHQYPPDAAESTLAGTELAHRTSASLIEDLRITDKVSQNLHAELALRAVGRAR